MKSTILVILLAAGAANADIYCSKQTSVPNHFHIIEDVEHPDLNTLVKANFYLSKHKWLGKSTQEMTNPDKLGGFMTKKTIDLGENGKLTLVSSKKSPLGFTGINCGRGGCDDHLPLPLPENISAQYVSADGSNVLVMDCNEKYND